MNINIPQNLGDKSLLSFFHGWNWFDDPGEEVFFKIDSGTHLAPWAVTLFASYAIWLREVRGSRVELHYPPDSHVARFIEKMGFPQLLGQNAIQQGELDSKVFPLRRFSENKEIPGIASGLSDMLAIDDIEMEGAVRYSLVELLRNVIQHSRSRIGGLVSAVYFPKSGLVDIVVCDIGCGLTASLSNAYPEINAAHKAVRFAILPHVSGTFRSGEYQTMKDNAGLGLFFIKEIAALSQGGFFLGSGNVVADIWGNADGSLGKKYVQSKTGGWRGTFALLQLRREKIAEFDALLAHCREIAAEVRKNRSELAVDFVDEEFELDDVLCIKIREFDEDVECAARIRDNVVLPKLDEGEIVILDFKDVRASTQSFIHALMYRVFRDGNNLETCLTVQCADRATVEAIKAVAAYASKNIEPA